MNKIYHIRERLLVPELTDERTYYVELDGQYIQNKVDLLNKLKHCFHLPDAYNWDAVLDWLTDLSWIDKESYLLCIINFNQFLLEDSINRQIFLDILSEIVAWWDGDVEKYVVGGKKKEFNVYLVD